MIPKKVIKLKKNRDLASNETNPETSDHIQIKDPNVKVVTNKDFGISLVSQDHTEITEE